MSDIVSVKIAERLREAGWPQLPKAGTYYIPSHGHLCFIDPISSGLDNDRYWFIQEGEDTPLVLPSRRDLELAIAEMGYTKFSYYIPPATKMETRPAMTVFKDHKFNIYRIADTPADAVALAYLEAMKREQDAR